MYNTASIIVDNLNSIIWGTVTVALILLTGIYFSVRTKFIQVRKIRTIFRVTLFGKDKNRSGEKHTVTQFQALSTALAASMGTGNIAGVASAIAIGGAGAVFWMWVSAFFWNGNSLCRKCTGSNI